jgi:Ca2+-binding RTX toxin-like protein
MFSGSGSEVLSGGDGNDSLFAGGSTFQSDTLIGGDGADRYIFGTSVISTAISGFTAANASVHLISGFARGTDKIQLLTGIVSTAGTPGVSGSAVTFGGVNTISYVSSGADLVVMIHGNASNYLMIKLTGISVVDINDFEFL